MTYDETLTLYRELAAKFDVVVKGKANPYTSMNGNMFSFLDKDGVLCLRLSKPGQAEFRDTHGGGPVMQYGSVMKDYVAVPEAMLADVAAMAEAFGACLDHAKTLKPKPTKKT